MFSICFCRNNFSSSQHSKYICTNKRNKTVTCIQCIYLCTGTCSKKTAVKTLATHCSLYCTPQCKPTLRCVRHPVTSCSYPIACSLDCQRYFLKPTVHILSFKMSPAQQMLINLEKIIKISN